MTHIRLQICHNCGSVPSTLAPITVTNSGPAKGVRLSKARIVCPCGWSGPAADTIDEATFEWNRFMGQPRNEADGILGQITLNDADELSGDMLRLLRPEVDSDSDTHDWLYGQVHDEITGRFRDK